MPEEKLIEEEAVREEETAAEETIHREEGEEVREKERTEETVQREEEHTAEAVHKEEYTEETVHREKEIAGEPVYTEGGNMGNMAEQDYITVEEEKPGPDFLEEEPKKGRFFRRNREDAHFLRDRWILSRIRDEDLMDYLVLEQKRNEQLQEARDIRERRIVSAFKLTVSLAAGVAVVYLLKDNPTIFVNILYIGGILGGFWFWKNPREK